MANGIGRLIHADGDLYEGEWKNDNQSGAGRYQYRSGDLYNGNFINGNESGYGEMEYANGDYYIGCWKKEKIKPEVHRDIQRKA